MNPVEQCLAEVAVMFPVTEDQRRAMIVKCAEDCELSLLRADRVRTGTLRERYTAIAVYQKDASLLAEAAFSWCRMELRA